MSSDLPNLPKYKLARRAESEEVPQPPEESYKEKEAEIRPLELSQKSEQILEDEPMDSTADMLEDAYGAETRARRGRERMKLLNRITVAITTVFLFSAGTLAYAHAYEKWPPLQPTNWYLPFLLSAALSAWFCTKSIRFWEDRGKSSAVFGILAAGLLVYWNLHILEYAAKIERLSPNNGLWAPTDMEDLFITSQLNALRGISPNKNAYTRLPEEAYQRAFNSIPREDWRPYFKQHLNAEEMQQVTRVNIQEKMYTVVERIRETREKTWEALEAQLKQPEFEFRIQQALLKPYTWLLSYL
jgi:hypothetical protein